MDKEQFEEYKQNVDKPFLNRVTKGQYPPSSIFKIVTSLSALKDDEVSFYRDTAYCQAGLQVGPEFKKCEGWHQRQNLHQALVNSCNTYFTGWGSISVRKRSFAMLPNTFSWETLLASICLMKSLAGANSPLEIGAVWELLVGRGYGQLVYGQGFLLTTIIQLNTLMAAIANDGIAYELIC